MKYFKTCFFALMCAYSLQAIAQWQWIDNDGRKVFSDRAPSLNIPEKNIVSRPHQSGALPSVPSAAEAPASDAAKPTLAGAAAAGKGVDKELEARIAKEEAEKAAKEKAYAEKVAAEKKENCSRALKAKATLNSGQLMKTTNGKGEQVFMDDATRNAERKRAEAVIASDCAP